MAEFDLGDLWWLKKRDWLEEPNSALIGLQISQRQQQQQRDYALRLGEFGLRQKEADVQMHGQMLSQQIKQTELDDESELNRAFAAKQAGQDVTPNLKLGSSQEKWMRLNTMRDMQSGNQQEWTDLLKDFNALDGDGKAQIRQDTIKAGGQWPPKPGQILPETYHSLGTAQKQKAKEAQDRALALRSVAPTINAESRENVELLRSMQRDEAAKSSGDGTPALMADGTPVPGMVKFWTGRTWQYRNVHDPNDVKSMTPSQQISGLNSLIRVNKGIAEGGFATPEEAKAAHAKMLEYTARLDDLMKKHPQAAGVTPETKASKANTLSKQHPDWSRQQIIDEVNRQVP